MIPMAACKTNRQWIKAFAAHTALLAFAWAIPSSDAQSGINWQPASIEWSCVLQVNNERLCSLTVTGEEPTGADAAPQASGMYRIQKGSVAAQGPVLATIPFTIDCARLPNNILSCTGISLLRLGVGVVPAIDNTLRTTAFSIRGAGVGLLFDWNEDNAQTASFEGVVALRYLAGFRGSSLSEGLSLPNGVTSSTLEQAAAIGDLNEWYRFGEVAAVAPAGGTIFLRCMLGLRGVSLTGGVAPASTTIDNKCAEITTRE